MNKEGSQIVETIGFSQTTIQGELSEDTAGLTYINHGLPEPNELNVYESLFYNVPILLISNKRLWKIESGIIHPAKEL